MSPEAFRRLGKGKNPLCIGPSDRPHNQQLPLDMWPGAAPVTPPVIYSWEREAIKAVSSSGGNGLSGGGVFLMQVLLMFAAPMVIAPVPSVNSIFFFFFHAGLELYYYGPPFLFSFIKTTHKCLESNQGIRSATHNSPSIHPCIQSMTILLNVHLDYWLDCVIKAPPHGPRWPDAQCKTVLKCQRRKRFGQDLSW